MKQDVAACPGARSNRLLSSPSTRHLPPSVGKIQNIYLILLFPDERVQDLEKSGVLSRLAITHVGDAVQRAPSAPRRARGRGAKSRPGRASNQCPCVHTTRRVESSSEAQASGAPCPQTTTRALTMRCRGPARPAHQPVCSSLTRGRRALIRGWRLPPRPRSPRSAVLALPTGRIQLLTREEERPSAKARQPSRTPIDIVGPKPSERLRKRPQHARRCLCAIFHRACVRCRRQADRQAGRQAESRCTSDALSQTRTMPVPPATQGLAAAGRLTQRSGPSVIRLRRPPVARRI